MGWRLPTIDELTTLIDLTQSNPLLPYKHPFTNVKTGVGVYYWSSTSDSNDTSQAWIISLNHGQVSIGNKLVDNYVRAVRSTQ